MYESFYQLKEKPFSLLPDPHFLYLGDDQSLALAMLEYGLVDNAGFIVLTGPIGSGKTTLIRQLLGNLESSIQVGYVVNTHVTFGSLLKQILASFDIDDQGVEEGTALNKIFVDYLLDNYAKHQETVLIIDEAQNVPPKELEQLRLISNINSENDQLLNIILVGQPELKATIALDSLKQFSQRISVFHQLNPLTADHVESYIASRLETAGTTEKLFSPQAIQLIASASGGIPRLINRLSESALVYGYASETKEISAAIMEQVIADQRRAGLLNDTPSRVSDKGNGMSGSSWFKEPLNSNDRRLLAGWVFAS